MRQFNYKCVVEKNGTKMYYKRVKGKWKQISNKLGKNAEKGKRKYMMELPKEYIFTMKKDTLVFKSLKYTRKEIDNTTVDKILAEKIKNSTLYDDTQNGDPKWFALDKKVLDYGRSNNGFVVWIKVPEKEDIDRLNKESFRGIYMSGVCRTWMPKRKGYRSTSFEQCKNLLPLYYKPEFGCGPFIEVKFDEDLKLINLSDSKVYDFIFNLKEDVVKDLIKDDGDFLVIFKEKLCNAFVDCGDNNLPKKISRRSSFNEDEEVATFLKKIFPDIDGYYYNNKEDTFHPEICVWKWPIKTTTRSIEECKHENISSPLIKTLNIPTYDQFLKGDFPEDYNSKLYIKEEYKKIIEKNGFRHFILDKGLLGE